MRLFALLIAILFFVGCASAPQQNTVQALASQEQETNPCQFSHYERQGCDEGARPSEAVLRIIGAGIYLTAHLVMFSLGLRTGWNTNLYWFPTHTHAVTIKHN